MAKKKSKEKKVNVLIWCLCTLMSLLHVEMTTILSGLSDPSIYFKVVK